MALIDEVHRVAGERTWFRTSRDSSAAAIVALLGRIRAAGEPLAIPQIISLTLDARADVAEAAGDAVRALRELVGMRDVTFFDRAFRRMSAWHTATERWQRMAPADLRRIAGLRSGPTLLQLAMCHPNGHVRHRGVAPRARCRAGAATSGGFGVAIPAARRVSTTRDARAARRGRAERR